MKTKMKRELLKHKCYKTVFYNKELNAFTSVTLTGDLAFKYKLNKLHKAPNNTMGFFVYKSLEDLCKSSFTLSYSSFSNIKEVKDLSTLYSGQYCILECECSKFWIPKTFINPLDFYFWAEMRKPFRSIITSIPNISLVKDKKTNTIQYRFLSSQMQTEDSDLNCTSCFINKIEHNLEFKPYTVFYLKPKKVFV